MAKRRSKTPAISESPDGRKRTAAAENPAKGRRPVIGEKPAGARKPVIKDFLLGRKVSMREAELEASLDQNIAWRIFSMDQGGKFKCTLKELEPYREKLAFYESLSREEAETMKHCHPLGAAKLSDAGQARAAALGFELDTFYQLKLDRAGRLWGFWTQNVFNILWLDRTHDVYQPGPR